MTIWFLLFIPLMMLAAAFAVSQTQAVTGADVDLQGALKSAVKAAALQVTVDSQANGIPRIGADTAHNAFRQKIAENLGLDAAMSPSPGSLLGWKPDYVLLVYNGDNTFFAGGAVSAYRYSFQDGVLTSGNLVLSGLPKTFRIIDNNIEVGVGGERDVTLDKPGVIAVINEKQIKIMGKEEMEITRWAAAKVVY